MEATQVEVETTFTRGLPAFSIVGLANSSIQESRDRVKSALISNDFNFPPSKITVNLSPSDVPSKKGSHFDLGIALLIALQKERVEFDTFHVFGELGLDGLLKDSKDIFALILSLYSSKKIKKVLIPKQSLYKISLIPDIEIYSVDNLKGAIEFFRNKENQDKYLLKDNRGINCKHLEIMDKKYYYESDFEIDFLNVKGQEIAKRASLICASGGHNMLMEGSPGCGKSMIAKRIPHILPPMSLEEILYNAKLDTLDCREPNFKPIRNFRSPHHSSTKSSIFGGGSKDAKMGEVALSHNGILFFDEFTMFDKKSIDSLREPLENYEILVSRVNSKINYKTKFIFIGAQNPCPCGNLLSKSKECRCNDIEIKRYKNKISEPILDRIDLFIQMQENSSIDKPSVSSKELQQEVFRVFELQIKRGQKELNGRLDDKSIEKFCHLDDASKNILNQAIGNFGLSHRSVAKVIKISKTIADLDSSSLICKEHILEALSYRIRAS